MWSYNYILEKESLYLPPKEYNLEGNYKSLRFDKE